MYPGIDIQNFNHPELLIIMRYRNARSSVALRRKLSLEIFFLAFGLSYILAKKL